MQPAQRGHTCLTGNQAAPELSVIVPTFNERANLAKLISRVEKVLDGIAFEIVIVDDDSPDGTGFAARTIARENPKVRVLRRLGRKGLATACLEGMLSSAATYFAVIDADLQHDEALLPSMLEALRHDQIDIAIASRYSQEGGTGDWPKHRVMISRTGNWFANSMGRNLSTDPMSGFFMVRSDFVDKVAPRLSSNGFKILLDLILSSPQPPRIRDLPYIMRKRVEGDSKLDTLIAIDLLLLIVHKRTRKILPPRFLRFVASGLFGACVHLCLLTVLYLGFGFSFLSSQGAAAGAAMVVNFAINNRLTFADQRLTGLAEITGLAKFLLISSLGGLINITLAEAAFETGVAWWLSGMAGAFVGAVWNYWMSASIVWQPTRQQRVHTSKPASDKTSPFPLHGQQP